MTTEDKAAAPQPPAPSSPLREAYDALTALSAFVASAEKSRDTPQSSAASAEQAALERDALAWRAFITPEVQTQRRDAAAWRRFLDRLPPLFATNNDNEGALRYATEWFNAWDICAVRRMQEEHADLKPSLMMRRSRQLSGRFRRTTRS